MSVEREIETARKKIYRDGYDMSFGELINMYERKEIFVNPEFQRLFRWSSTQKTRFIESILLNIPIPPIFVFTRDDGVWELIDGLQRLSTVMQFAGVLRKPNGSPYENFVCEGTNLVPSLNGVSWDGEPAQDLFGVDRELPSSLKLAIKRARIRVEILNKDSDSHTKYELFQRLNTGGSHLSEQEIRNCIIISINKDVYDWLSDLSVSEDFVELCSVSGGKMSKQYNVELMTRLFVYRNFPYSNGLDLHEYLDKSIIEACEGTFIDYDREREVILETFSIIRRSIGERAFKVINSFSLARYEFLTFGVSKIIEKNVDISDEFLVEKFSSMNNLEEMSKYTGAGVRGTTRLGALIFGKAPDFFGF